LEKKILEIMNGIRRKHNLEELKEISSSQTLRGDFGFDSFDLAELTVKIEDETGVDIFENGIIDSVGEMLSRLGM